MYKAEKIEGMEEFFFRQGYWRILVPDKGIIFFQGLGLREDHDKNAAEIAKLVEVLLNYCKIPGGPKDVKGNSL